MAIDAAEVERPRMRAGFWRRLLGFLIDMVIVLIPLQLAVAILFAQTNGAIQGAFGFNFTQCDPAQALPQGLEPPPPADANYAVICSVSFLGLETGRTLVVGKETKVGNITTNLFQSYLLGADGQPRDAYDVTWIALLIFFIYLVTLERRSAQTLGKRVMKIQTIDTSAPATRQIPVKKAAVRMLSVFIGFVPALLTAYLPFFVFGSMAELETYFRTTLHWTFFGISTISAIGWILWNVIAVARKKDPPYDRIAGTAVLRS